MSLSLFIIPHFVTTGINFWITHLLISSSTVVYNLEHVEKDDMEKEHLSEDQLRSHVDNYNHSN